MLSFHQVFMLLLGVRARCNSCSNVSETRRSLLCTILYHGLWKTEFQARKGPIPQVSAFCPNSVFIGHFRDSVRDSVNTDFIYL